MAARRIRPVRGASSHFIASLVAAIRLPLAKDKAQATNEAKAVARCELAKGFATCRVRGG
ncbi:hypothetical protein [Agrobacterium vitis]|uniref:hypothetical protein n=1 Tax=Agrobacterium vitis TaxID=373 RepID=UPI0012E7CBD9|nr:hypothetical protein [Agrobacterium vitis]MVA33649.1 hypothetical protein [Agrobacterium vitis]